MKIYLIGNPLIPEDSLPLQLEPILKVEFPHIEIIEADPNENFIPEDGSIIIDTVKGIKDIAWFSSPSDFVETKSVTAHDYDLGFHLYLLRKLKKIHGVNILGIPYGNSLNEISGKVMKLLDKTISST